MLSARGLTKRFVGHTVLEDVDLELRAGQVHGLVGENGAGKSTLMKILAGVHQADEGTVELQGRTVSFSHPVQAQQAGVSTVFQEFNLLPERTIAENVHLGREPRKYGLVDLDRMNRETQALLDDLGVTGLRATQRVRSLSVAEQQVVEIAKALSYDAQILSMDEPTAALADHEVALLYSIIERLTARGVAILYVSHRIKEIFDLCEVITVLKDGRQVATRPAAELDDAELVRLMVGRSISSFFPDKLEGTEVGEPLLQLTDAGNGYVDGVDLTLRAGEIVGIAGLQGSGRTELLEAVFGVRPAHPRHDDRRRPDGPAALPPLRHPRRPRDDHRGPQGHRTRPQPDHPRQHARRGPRGLPAPYRRRPPRGARPALLARGLRAGDGPGGPVPLRRQPAEGRAGPLARRPARASSSWTSPPAASTSAPSTRSTS